MKKIVTYVVAFLIVLTQLTSPALAENDVKVALGASNDEASQQKLLEMFHAQDLDEKKIFSIDGELINKYLDDGSDASTDILSSAKVQFMGAGYGVNVFILTPDNITEVSESTYENAAIAAGASNVYITIASTHEVTGEGALGGVYEIFSQSGISLDASAIKNAENLIGLEQFLNEETTLNDTQISRLITHFNLKIVNYLEENDQIDNDQLTELLTTLLEEYQFDLQEDIVKEIVNYGKNFSQTDVVKDPETKKSLEEAMAKYEEMDTALGQPIEVEDGIFVIDEVKIIKPGQVNNNSDYDLLTFYFSFTLNEDAETTSADMAWIQYVEVIQDSDDNFINGLSVGGLGDTSKIKDQFKDMKPGGTVQTIMSYEIEDLETTVQVEFKNRPNGDKVIERLEINPAAIQ